MGCHEQLRREVAEDTPDVVDTTATAARGRVPEADVGPRRPSEELSREAFVRHVGHVERLPVEFKLEGGSPIAPHVPAIRQSFLGAVNDLEKKLEGYVEDTGGAVEQVSSRSFGGGAVGRWLSRTSLAQWYRGAFPVYAYEISQSAADGTRQPICHVRISQRFLSDSVVVRVAPCKGRENSARKVLEALSARVQSSAEEGAGATPADTKGVVKTEFRNAQRQLDEELRFHREKDSERSQEAKELGLSSNASDDLIQEVRDLVGDVRRAAERISRGTTSRTYVSRGKQSSIVVLDEKYPRFLLEPVEALVANIATSGIAIGLPCFLGGPLALALVVATFTMLCLVSEGEFLRLFVNFSVLPVARARLASLAKKQGSHSLGEVLSELREAGFDVKCKVGYGPISDSYEEGKSVQRVRLTVSHRARDVK